jgi:hypothetical protein
VFGPPLPAWALIAGRTLTAVATSLLVLAVVIAVGVLAYGVHVRAGAVRGLVLTAIAGAAAFACLAWAVVRPSLYRGTPDRRSLNRRETPMATDTLQTRRATCPQHGEVEAQRVLPGMRFPFVYYAIKRALAARRPYRCPDCGSPV